MSGEKVIFVSSSCEFTGCRLWVWVTRLGLWNYYNQCPQPLYYFGWQRM